MVSEAAVFGSRSGRRRSSACSALNGQRPTPWNCVACMSTRPPGIARLMLRFAEAECRRSGVRRLELSTSELQPAALELYRHAGYRLLHEVVAEQASNKTLGGGIRRYYFEKIL